MENRIAGRGTGILDLASIYVRPHSKDQKDEEVELRAEEMFQRLQDLPPDGTVDRTCAFNFGKIRPISWTKLVARMIADMKKTPAPSWTRRKPHMLWLNAAKGKEQNPRPDYHQVIRPYLHEDFGTEPINEHIQKVARGVGLKRVGQLAGITLSTR